MNITYLLNTSSAENILDHLNKVEKSFYEPLSLRVNIYEYSKKLCAISNRIEAWDNEVLVGLVAFYLNEVKSECYVTNVSVLDQYAHCGIATCMLSKLDDFVAKHKISKIILDSYETTEFFYKKCGYVIDSEDSHNKKRMIKRFDNNL